MGFKMTVTTPGALVRSKSDRSKSKSDGDFTGNQPFGGMPDRDSKSDKSDRDSSGSSALKLRARGNKRAGDVSPKVRSRRKSRSFRVR